MALLPQIVHTCNHVVETHEKKIEALPVIRAELGDMDQIFGGSNIYDIYSVYKIIDKDNLINYFYHKDADYRKIGKHSIEWIGNNRPAPSEEYYVECYYIKSNIVQYEEEDCPRCMSNGWYVDLMPQSERAVNKLSGANKIVQDFIKILFTYRLDGSNYGTRIVDYAGKVVSDPNQICSEIASVIYSAASKYIDLQLSSVLDGNQLTDDEILDRISVDQIDYDIDTGGVYALVTLYSRSGESREIGAGL